MTTLVSSPTFFHARWNWPRVGALASTLSLHAFVILVLLIPATALRLLRPAAEPPVTVTLIEPPPKIVEVALPVPLPLVHPQPHMKPRPVQQQPAPTPVESPNSTIQANIDPVAHDDAPVAPVDSAPTALAYHTRTPVPYPRDALRLHEQGTVVLRVLVGNDGLPQMVEVEKSSGSRSLDSAARDAVRRWTFQPGTHNGVAVALWARVPVAFNLSVL